MIQLRASLDITAVRHTCFWLYTLSLLLFMNIVFFHELKILNSQITVIFTV